MNAICKQVLDLASRQIGYKETGDNITKYARFFDVEAWQWFNTKKNGVPGVNGGWCAIFCCWLLAQNETLGQKQALSFLGCPSPKNNCAAGCGFLYDYMKTKGYKSTIANVKPGDFVFFKDKKGKCYHVGICFDVDGNNIHTIEGNKDNQVKKCHHYKNSDIYFGVMSPKWENAHFFEDPNKDKEKDFDNMCISLARRCIRGDFGNGITRKQKLNALGYGNIYSKVQTYVNMILKGQLK